MGICEKIKFERESRGWSQSELGKKCGWKGDRNALQSRIQTYEKGREPKWDVLKQLASVFGIHPFELLAGDEDIAPAPLATDYAFIPSYDATASAGPGILAITDNLVGEMAFKTKWLARKGLNPRDLVTCYAEGDSMTPTIEDGDILLLDRSERHKIRNGKIYVLRQDDELRVKRITKTMAGGYLLGSDNKAYDPETIGPDSGIKLKPIGRVIWVGREVP